jgi:hypothetical protein
MSVNYTFIRNSDNERMTIAAIDNLICEFHGITPDPDNCNIIYESTVMAGISASFHEGVTNEKNVEEVIVKLKAGCPKEEDSKFIEGLRKFLYKDYHMDSWRTWGSGR